MIGLSLSLCVRDILSGSVNIEDVDTIIAGTCAYNNEKWERLINGYSESYWSDYPRATIDAVITQIRPIIVQPRIENNNHFPMIYNGHWVNSEDEIIWSDAQH